MVAAVYFALQGGGNISSLYSRFIACPTRSCRVAINTLSRLPVRPVHGSSYYSYQRRRTEQIVVPSVQRRSHAVAHDTSTVSVCQSLGCH